MIRWLCFTALFYLTACAPPKLSFDPRPYLTPREIYLVFDLAYGDNESPRWSDLRGELSHLQTFGLVELYPQAKSDVPSAWMTSRGFQVATALGWEEDFHGHPNLRPNQSPPLPIKVVLPEDLPPFPGQTEFYRLPRAIALEKGRHLAQEDDVHGFHRFLYCGVQAVAIPASTEVYWQQRGLYYYRLSAALVPTEGLSGIIEGYNGRMTELLQAKWQNPPLDLTASQPPPMASNFPNLSSREMYLLLDMAYGTRGSPLWYQMVPELNQLEVSGLISRHLDEEKVIQYRWPVATLTPRGEHLAYWLGWNRSFPPTPGMPVED